MSPDAKPPGETVSADSSCDATAVTPAASAFERAASRYAVRTLGILALMLVLVPVVVRYLDPTIAEWAPELAGSALFTPLRAGIGIGATILVPALGCAYFAVRAWRLRSRWHVRAAVLMAGSIFLTGVLTDVVKTAAPRARPGAPELQATAALSWADRRNNTVRSFPSGDVATAATAAWVIILVTGGARVGYLWLLGPALVASTRVIAGRHYVSDCIAGFVLGTGVALLLWWAWRVPDQTAPSAASSPEPRSTATPS